MEEGTDATLFWAWFLGMDKQETSVQGYYTSMLTVL